MSEKDKSLYDLEHKYKAKEILGSENFEERYNLINKESLKKNENGEWEGVEALQKLFPVQDRKINNPPHPKINNPSNETREEKIKRLKEEAGKGNRKAREELNILLRN